MESKMDQQRVATDQEVVNRFRDSVQRIKSEIKKKVIGQQKVIDDLLACFLSGGHCLLIGVPGLAKTTLIQSLSRCLHLDFNRIQFTPDLMPSDITGSEILFEDRATGVREFRFIKGPLFSNIVLADEINRTPPKTQSALLQAMQEQEITSSGKTFELPKPFWVLATQNPIEQEGTYPLPEAQQDRFMFSIEIGYPQRDEEIQIVKSTTRGGSEVINAVVTLEDILLFRDLVWRIPVADSVVNAAVSIVRATRPAENECPMDIKNLLTWGAGPRASQFIILAAKAYALLDDRSTPDVEDVKKASFPVLRHRLVKSFHAEVDNVDCDDIIKRIVEVTLKSA